MSFLLWYLCSLLHTNGIAFQMHRRTLFDVNTCQLATVTASIIKHSLNALITSNGLPVKNIVLFGRLQRHKDHHDKDTPHCPKK